MRLSENVHLPFGRLTALSKVEGLRYPPPSSLRGVLLCTPHSSGFVRASLGLPTLRAGPQFRKPCIWTFSVSLPEGAFSTVSIVSLKNGKE
jgi:hypothetical protein